MTVTVTSHGTPAFEAEHRSAPAPARSPKSLSFGAPAASASRLHIARGMRLRNLRALCLPLFGVTAALLVVATGCDVEDVPVERRLCERFDACNYFGPGIDVADCTDIMTMCTDTLVTSQREDWAAATRDALDRNNCVNVLADYQSIGVCAIRSDGSVADGDSPGSSSSSGSSTSGGSSTSDGGGDSAGSDGQDGPGCDERDIACTGPNTIEACIAGVLERFDCNEVCAEGGYQYSDECAFDPERGHDVCYCVGDDAPAPPPG
jgi:hypothetical protein